jgi:hypothetical protein
MFKRLALAIITTIVCTTGIQAQTASIGDTTNPPLKSPEKYIDAVGKKAGAIEQKLDKKSEKALAQLKKQEDKIINKIAKADTLLGKQLREQATARYKELEEKLKNPGKLTQYLSGLDSSSTALQFLQTNPTFKQAKEVQEKLKEAIGKTDALKTQLQKAESIKQFLKERREFLKHQVAKFGFSKQLKQLNKQVYYYSQQIAEYKVILQDPKKIEKKALEILTKQKFFQDFMRKNSMLASLFRMHGDPNDPTAQASLAGLQTRAQVNNLIQTQIANGGPNAQQQIQQNIQAAQSRLNQLKDRVMKWGGSSSDMEMPEGFKPNNQKTKSFLQRIELGTNLQNQKSNGLLPSQSDIGLSVGYKINDKSVIGVGSSFKMGWNQPGQRGIRLSGQGASLRSFVDIKMKGSFWVSGGYEMNYNNAFSSIAALQNYSGWRQSGLVGMSKIVNVKSKLFKKTKLMLLWDFLSYQVVPRAQPIVFRIGYNF